jgi:hypothetical protein
MRACPVTHRTKAVTTMKYIKPALLVNGNEGGRHGKGDAACARHLP